MSDLFTFTPVKVPTTRASAACFVLPAGTIVPLAPHFSNDIVETEENIYSFERGSRRY